MLKASLIPDHEKKFSEKRKTFKNTYDTRGVRKHPPFARLGFVVSMFNSLLKGSKVESKCVYCGSTETHYALRGMITVPAPSEKCTSLPSVSHSFEKVVSLMLSYCRTY